MIREIRERDLDGLLTLYMQLHDNPFPQKDDRILALWHSILNDPHHHIIIAEEDGKIVSSCVCVVIPNLTRGQRPYAFIENAVTEVLQAGWRTADIKAPGAESWLSGSQMTEKILEQLGK